MILLLAFIVQEARAHTEDHLAVLDQKADIVVDKLFGRSLKSWVLHHTDADSATLGKLGTSAKMPKTNPVMTLIRHATPDFAGYRSQYQTPIIPFRLASYHNVIPHAHSKSGTTESAKSAAEAAAAEAAVTDILDSREASPAAVKKVQEAQANQTAAVKRAEEAEAIAAEANAKLAAIEAEAIEAEAEAMLAAYKSETMRKQLRKKQLLSIVTKNKQKSQEAKAEADSTHAPALAAAEKRAAAAESESQRLQEAEAAARAAAAAAEERAATAEAEAEKWRPTNLQFSLNLLEQLADSSVKSQNR